MLLGQNVNSYGLDVRDTRSPNYKKTMSTFAELLSEINSWLGDFWLRFTTSHPYAYNLEHLGMYYKGYRKIMHNWKNILNIPIMDVQYEDLVANQEEVSRKLIEFCELDWNDQCLRFHENKRIVSTASFDQVRRPMYNTSSGRWKNYEQFLEPLKNALRE